MIPVLPIKPRLLTFFLLLSCISYGRQTSTIKIDSGNNNKISVVQAGQADSQRSDIDVNKSDSNNIKIDQKKLSAEPSQKKDWFNDLINNTGALFALLVSIATLIGLIWKGHTWFKKRKKRKK